MTKAAAAAPADASADLGRTIEAVIADKSYGSGRYKQAAAARPTAAAVTFSADTLRADLSAARQGKPAEPKSKKMPRAPRMAAHKPHSLVDQAFALGAVAVVMTALLALSPWGRELLAPVVRLLQ